MAKVVIKKFGAPKDGIGGTAVKERRVRDAATGKFKVVRTVDASSETIGRDLHYVFRRNVAKARRENKIVTGAADRAPSDV